MSPSPVAVACSPDNIRPLQSQLRVRRDSPLAFLALNVGNHVVRGPAREVLDVRILDDRLVELRKRYVDQRKAPASAVYLQMAGSVIASPPNRWPTWPRVNIQLASLVN